MYIFIELFTYISHTINLSFYFSHSLYIYIYAHTCMGVYVVSSYFFSCVNLIC